MASLVIPENGVSLGSAPGNYSKAGSSGLPAAYGISLSDTLIEDMIKCVQNGESIQLSLGAQPNFTYGSKTQYLSTSPDPFTHELFQSTKADYDDDDSSETETMELLDKHGGTFRGAFNRPKMISMFGPNHFKAAPKPAAASSKAKVAATTTSGADTALAQLQNSLASAGQRKADNTTKFISNAPAIPGQRKGAGKATNNKKLLASNRLGLDSIRSTPASPALSGVGSPALVSTSVPLSQVAADKAKASRKPIIHLLATGPMTKAALKQALPDVAENDFEQALERVADAKGNKWELTRKYWRELDVWTYDYPEADDRQRAIDNAVSMFDKLRLTVTDPEWDRLLPKVERGQGKCLSKLQVQIAQGLARPPKIKLQKDDGSGRDTSAGEEEGSLARKAMSKAKKGEPMIRSSSQPSATKPKPSEKEAPKKRVLTNKLNKPAAKPVVKPAASPRSTPAPAKRDKIGKPTSKKALSAEKIIDSDEEAEQASQPSQSKPSQPPKKPLPKPVVAKKRPRDDETETSDSSIPLSKKVKKDVLTQPRVASGNQSSNATSNATNSTHSLKNKSTSPHKSSPLASSPPTNASEIDNNSGHRTTSSSSASPAPYSSNKTSRSPIHKHHKTSSVTSSSSSGSTRHLKPEVMDLARKYRSYYPKYQALYHEVENSKFRDAVKEEQLLDMHKRLETMKQQINAGIFEM